MQDGIVACLRNLAPASDSSLGSSPSALHPVRRELGGDDCSFTCSKGEHPRRITDEVRICSRHGQMLSGPWVGAEVPPLPAYPPRRMLRQTAPQDRSIGFLPPDRLRILL